MAKSIEQFYEEIIGSNELKAEFAQLVNNKDLNGLKEFALKHDCNCSAQEAKDFFQSELKKEQDKLDELSPEELEQASGGSFLVGLGIALLVDSIAFWIGDAIATGCHHSGC